MDGRTDREYIGYVGYVDFILYMLLDWIQFVIRFIKSDEVFFCVTFIDQFNDSLHHLHFLINNNETVSFELTFADKISYKFIPNYIMER